jgi:hypothetical protein
MRQEGDNCGKSKAGPFWRRWAGFLFQTSRFSRTLIADPRSVLSVIVRGCVINAFFVDGRCMNARPDAILFTLPRAHLDEPALTVIRAACARAQAGVSARSRGCAVAWANGIGFIGGRMRRKEIESGTFNSMMT